MMGMRLSSLPDNIQAMIAMYAPLDGMNEKGLAVSVNMIQDGAAVSQNTSKPDITTTTAIRLLLNNAADVNEAIELLDQYDTHSSMGMSGFVGNVNAANSEISCREAAYRLHCRHGRTLRRSNGCRRRNRRCRRFADLS